MAKNPPYVRLAERLTVGMLCDTLSGWAISGNDVQPFPEDNREQRRFVTRHLRAGDLEPATEAEWEEAHPEEDLTDEEREAAQTVELIQAAVGKKAGPMQEAQFRRKVDEQHRRVREVRAENTDDDDYDDDEAPADISRDRRAARSQARRERILAEQNDEVSDDPEEQRERTATRPAAGARKRKAKAKSAKSKEKEPADA